MQLNDDQLAAYELIKQFAADPTKNEMLLIGAGGVGKGVLLNHLFKNEREFHKECAAINSDYRVKLMAFTATTNEAVSVLVNKGTSAETIFKYACIRPTYSGKLVRGNNNPPFGKLVFVDEASMVDKATYDIVWEQLAGSKIVWVLDDAQLAPVGSPIPLVNSLGLPEARLTKIMRSNGDLQKFNTALRNGVLNATYPQADEFNNGVDIILTNRTGFREHIIEAYTEDWVPEKARVLVFRNVQRDMFNNAIHQSVLGYDDPYTTGTYLRQNGYSTKLNNGQCVRISHVEYGDSIEMEGTVFELRSYYTLDGKMYQELLDPKAFSNLFFALIKNKRKTPFAPEDFVNLTHTYSSTTHKAQGSTIETVFVDLVDIASSYSICKEMYRRLLYTAVSRASKRVIIKVTDDA